MTLIDRVFWAFSFPLGWILMTLGVVGILIVGVLVPVAWLLNRVPPSVAWWIFGPPPCDREGGLRQHEQTDRLERERIRLRGLTEFESARAYGEHQFGERRTSLRIVPPKGVIFSVSDSRKTH